MMPHISSLRGNESVRPSSRRALEQLDQFGGASAGAVLFQRSLTGAPRHRLQLPIFHFKRVDYIGGSFGVNNLFIGSEECVEALPLIADDRRAAGGCFKSPTGRTPTPLHH